MEEFGRDCSIRGYHVCKEILRQLLEKFWSVWESCTTFEIDMLWLWKKMGTAIRHLPWRLSRVCSFLLQQGGTISCTVTGGEGAEFSATPASISTCFSQRAIVSEVTGWCGLFTGIQQTSSLGSSMRLVTTSTFYVLPYIRFLSLTLVGWSDVISLINTDGSIPALKTLPVNSFPRPVNWVWGPRLLL